MAPAPHRVNTALARRPSGAMGWAGERATIKVGLTRRTGGRALGAGLGGGLLLAASLPPWGWWALGMVGAGVAYAALADRSPRGRLAVGAGAGLGLYAPGLWWLNEFHSVGFAAVLVLEAAILAAALALVPPRRSRALAFPAALVVAEAVRGAWPFGGLPLGGIDLGQVGGPLLPVARAGGHLLVVALTGAAGVALAHGAAWARRRPGPAFAANHARAAAAAASVVLAAVLVGHAAPSGRPERDLRVAAVQGGGPRGVRAVDSDPRRVLDAHLAVSAGVPAGVELVLWPEDVVDVSGAFDGSAEEAEIAALARRLGATLVVGVVEDTSPGRFRNAAVAWGPDGRQTARYDKVHRVPFGEYIPFRSVFGRLADVSAVPRDAEPGTGPAVLDTPVGAMGVSISYEVFFAHRAREAVREGGLLLLVPTNASSYTTSQVPTQEVAVARMRAVETGRWVVQAAPTGYSAVVDEEGRVRERGPLGDPAVLTVEVELRSGLTWATRAGDTPVVALALLALVATWTSTWLQVVRKPES